MLLGIDLGMVVARGRRYPGRLFTATMVVGGNVSLWWREAVDNEEGECCLRLVAIAGKGSSQRNRGR